jgi:transcriptional regulator with XRE-family HTH domain
LYLVGLKLQSQISHQEVFLMGVNNLKPDRLAEKLKQIRINKNLSQNEMLQTLGFDSLLFQGNISQYELGRREPPLPVLLAYARLAKVNVDVLIDDELDIS